VDLKEYVHETLKAAGGLPSGMGEEALKVRSSGSGAPTFHLKGIVDSDTNLAKMQTVDSGVEDFPPLWLATTQYGFASLSVGTNTRSLDDLYSDAYAAGTNNAIIPIIAQRSITLYADSANGAVVRVGNQQTSTTVGFPIPAGGSLTLEITRGSNIFLCAASGTQTVHWIAV
jgi:hypothetical protein